MENISYHIIDDVDEIFRPVDAKIEELWKKTYREEKGQLIEIKRYLFRAKKTALSLSTAFNSFVRWSKFTYSPIDIYRFIDRVYSLDFIQEKCPSLPKLIQDVAEKMTNNNPVLHKLIELVNENNSVPHILVITHESDRIKLKSLLNQRVAGNNVIVSSWKRLGSIIYDFTKHDSILLAIEPPTAGDDIYADKVNKIVFLLNNESLDIVKEYIDTMEIGSCCHPVYFVKPEKKGPNILKKMESELLDKKIETRKSGPVRKKKEIQQPASDKQKLPEIPDLFIDIKDWCRNEILRPSERKYIQSRLDSQNTPNENNIMSEKNQELVLAIEKNRASCILFPKHSMLYVTGISNAVEAGSLLGNHEQSPLKISISKKGISIKVHLAEWLMNDFDLGMIKRGKYTWDSFSTLLSDSIQWIDHLRNEALTYRDDKELAEKISRSGVFAKDAHHIRNWWRTQEGSIKTYDGSQVEIPIIERPKSKGDLDIIARAINDSELIQNADKIWEAVIQIQAMRNRFIDAFQKINLETEKLTEKTSLDEKKFLEILESQEIPAFFLQWFAHLDVFYAIELKTIVPTKNLPLFKRIYINEVYEK